jgi:hypothetical protein
MATVITEIHEDDGYYVYRNKLVGKPILRKDVHKSWMSGWYSGEVTFKEPPISKWHSHTYYFAFIRLSEEA